MMSREAVAQNLKRQPVRDAPMKRPWPVKRTVQATRGRPLQRSASIQRSATIQRSAVIEKPAVMYRSATGQKPLQRSASSQKPLPNQKSALSKSKTTTMKKSAVKRPASPKDNVVVNKRSSPAVTEDEPSKAIEKEEVKSHTKKEYELSARLSHALDLELQRIMIKVWQEFPDDPSTAEETLVANKFRNEAGDSLRNVLGLNVTKRLLNVHNSLYVKLYFKKQPERGTLSDFIRKHNMKTFKRIDNAANMFAAQMATFADFDRICKATDVYCGRVKVTVKPCYSFTTCPPNLKTIFSEIKKEKEENDKEENTDVVEEEKKKKVTNQTAETGEVKKDDDAKVKEDKVKNDVKSQVVENNIVPEVTNKASVEVVKKEKPEPQTVQAVTEKVTSNNINASDKPKERAVKKVDQKENTSNQKVLRQKMNIDKMKIIDTYDANENEEVPEKDFDEEDELDDKAILALMTEGIVLDECGSDEE